MPAAEPIDSTERRHAFPIVDCSRTAGEPGGVGPTDDIESRPYNYISGTL